MRVEVAIQMQCLVVGYSFEEDMAVALIEAAVEPDTSHRSLVGEVFLCSKEWGKRQVAVVEGHQTCFSWSA